MNNTEKKLDALIDALGFDVKEVFVCHIACKCKSNSAVTGGDRDCPICFGDGKDGTEFDYKVTKREPESINLHPDDLARLISTSGASGCIRIIK